MEDAKENEDLELLIDDDADKAASGEVEIEGKAGEQDWKAQFEGAQKKLEEANAKREEAERLRASDAERHARETAEARQSTVSAEMTAIENAIANAEHEKADAEDEYAAAMEAGDYRAAAKAQSKISEIAFKAQRIKEGKAHLERRAEDAKAMADPVERIAAQATPKSAAWIRAHGDMFRDPVKAKKVEQAHYLAIGNGHDAESDGYFQFVENQLYGKQEQTQEVRTDPPAVRSQSAPAAPPSRDISSPAATPNRNVVRLTAAEREIAAACGMTDAEYAKNKIAIQREGNTTH